MDQHNWLYLFNKNTALVSIMAIYYYFDIRGKSSLIPDVDLYFLLFSIYILVNQFIFHPLLTNPESRDFLELSFDACVIGYMFSLASPALHNYVVFHVSAVCAFTLLSAAVFAIPFVPFYAFFPSFWPARVVPLLLAIFSSARAILPLQSQSVAIFINKRIQDGAGENDLVKVGTAQTLTEFASLPASIKKLKVYQISDVHFGLFMSKEKLHWICIQAVDSHPDIIVLTGDFLSIETAKGFSENDIENILSPLLGARGKVFACLGNHDTDTAEGLESIKRALTNVGVTILSGAPVSITVGPAQKIVLTGVPYMDPKDSFTRTRMNDAVSAAGAVASSRDVFVLFLAHDPSAINHLGSRDRVDLMLCGHTHGGVWGFLTEKDWRATATRWMGLPDNGLWKKGQVNMYVHRGQGTSSFPLRLGIPPENGLLTIHYNN